MNRINGLIYCLLVTTTFFCGCERKPKIVIEGSIAGYINQSICIYPAQSIYINKPYGEPLQCINTDENGDFTFTINAKDDYFYYLFTKDQQLIIETPILLNRGDTVGFRTSIYNLSTPEFWGDNADFNQYMLQQSQTLSRIFRYNRVNEWPIDEFSCFVDSIELEYRNVLDSMVLTKSFEEKGIKMLKADLLLYMACKRFEYLRHHINETQGEWRYLIPSKTFYSFKDSLFEITSEFWFLPNFSQAIDAMLEDDFQNVSEVIANPVEMYSKRFKQKLQRIINDYSGIVKEVALSQLARRFPEYLSSSDFYKNMEAADSIMKGISREPTLLEYFTKQVEKVSNIKPEAIAPNLTLPNKSGKMVSLDEFKGKVVLLIFWGTWCPPCLTSIPKYIEIQEKFKDQDFAAVFISLEARLDDVEGWRMFIEGKGNLAERLLNGKPFPGVHLVALGQFANLQVQSYVITYAPSYVIIDQEGRIVSPRVYLDDSLISQVESLIH
jgi:thiol-disulfide isomerase/thioredoxin